MNAFISKDNCLIQSRSFFDFDMSRVPSPCFVIDEVVVEENLRILNQVQSETGAKVLIALKAFSMYGLAPLITKYISGTCASGVHEARLGFEYFGGKLKGEAKREIHVYNPAYKKIELDVLSQMCDHIVLNSATQWLRSREFLLAAQKNRPSLKLGVRINPMVSTGETELYDPCSKGSRLGMTSKQFKSCFPNKKSMKGLSGIHFHTLCEQGFDALELTLDVIEKQYKAVLPFLSWVNFGGGHHITKPGYDLKALIAKIKYFQKNIKYKSIWNQVKLL